MRFFVLIFGFSAIVVLARERLISKNAIFVFFLNLHRFFWNNIFFFSLPYRLFPNLDSGSHFFPGFFILFSRFFFPLISGSELKISGKKFSRGPVWRGGPGGKNHG